MSSSPRVGGHLISLIALALLAVSLAVPASAYPEQTTHDRQFPALGGGDFVLADLTGDGWTDMAAVDDLASVIRIYEGGPLGLPTETQIALPAADVLDLAVADLDGDGRFELVAVDGGTVRWFDRVAEGGWAGSPAFDAAGGRSVTAGDFDGDGRLDLAVAGSSGAFLWFQQSQGFPPVPLGLSGDAFDAVAAGDVDGDGRDDLVLAGPFEIRVHAQGDQGLALDPVRLPVKGSGELSVGLVQATGDAPVMAAVRSGDPLDDGTATLWRWDGLQFNPEATIEGPYTARFAVGDMNGDRRPDLALVRLDGSVAIFQQRGAFFALAVPDLTLAAVSQGWDHRIAVGDVNGDGLEDVLVRSRDPDAYSSYLQEDSPPVLIEAIPSTYAVNRGTVTQDVVDLRRFFMDDHNRLTFEVVFQSNPVHLTATVDRGALDFEASPDWYGTADFRVSAWDGNPNHEPVESNAFTVLVNDPPRVVSIPSLRAVVGEPYAYLVSVEDAFPANDAHTFTLLEPPEGMAIDVATGFLTWTPEDAGTNEVTVEVRDGYGGIAIQRFAIVVAPAGGPSPVPLLIVGVAATTAALLAAAALINENAKFAFLLFFLPLYTKIKRERVLDHFVRGEIFGYIQANPGEHYNAIKDALGLTNGSLAHHLRTLEREQFIKSKRFGLYRRFYPMNMRMPDDAFQPNQIQRTILDVVRDHAGITQKEISQRLGLTPPTVNYHVSALSDRNFIRVVRQGRSTHCSLVEKP